MPRIILASSSIYRKQLLDRIGLHYLALSPDIDESPLKNEQPVAMAKRLSLEKARAIASKHPDSLIIGSDQVADFNGAAVQKPGSHQRARQQLHSFSGKTVLFHSGLALIDTRNDSVQLATNTTSVTFHTLSEDQIEHYLLREQPYNCAGSFKAEALGITLFSQIQSDDPTSLIGLPLISLCTMLRKAGYEPLN